MKVYLAVGKAEYIRISAAVEADHRDFLVSLVFAYSYKDLKSLSTVIREKYLNHENISSTGNI